MSTTLSARKGHFREGINIIISKIQKNIYMNMEIDSGISGNPLGISNKDEDMSILLPRPFILKYMRPNYIH